MRRSLMVGLIAVFAASQSPGQEAPDASGKTGGDVPAETRLLMVADTTLAGPGNRSPLLKRGAIVFALEAGAERTRVRAIISGTRFFGTIPRNSSLRLAQAKSYLDARIKAEPSAWWLTARAEYWQEPAVMEADSSAAEKAVKDYDAAIDLEPGERHPHTGKARLFLRLRRFDEAARSFEKGLALEPNNPFDLIGLAEVHWEQGRYAEVSRFLEQAVTHHPKFASACNLLAWLKATCPTAEHRDGARAVELAQRACSLDSTEDEFVDTLAAAHAEQGEFSRAVEIQERLVKSHKGNFLDAYRERLELYRRNEPYRESPPAAP